MDYLDELYELIDEAKQLDHGDVQISLLEQAVRLADANNDIETAFEARNELIEACIFGGDALKAIIEFTWILGKYKQSPLEFNIYDVLVGYKWILPQLYDFINVPLSKINELFEDYKDMMLHDNCDLRFFYQAKCLLAVKGLDSNNVDEYYNKWMSTPSDEYSDCAACELDMQIEYHLYKKDYEKALEIFKPILSGKQTCSEIPHLTYSRFLLPLVRMGNYKLALEYEAKDYKLIYKNKEFINEIINSIICLSILNIDKAVERFTKHYDWHIKSKDDFHRFRFNLASWFLFEKIKLNNINEITLNIPEITSVFSDNGRYQVEELICHFKAITTEIAGKFDVRNCNTYFKDYIDYTFELLNI